MMTQTTASLFTGLHHFAFTVRGVQASAAWYQKVFQANLVDGTLPHYGREWTGYARLSVREHTDSAI